MKSRLVLFLLAFVWVPGAAGQDPPVTGGYYEPRLKDPILEKIKARDKAWRKQDAATTQTLKTAREEEEEEKKELRKALRADLPEGECPAGTAAFESVFHFEPQAQFMTGTCWAYAGTSFLESEVQRITNRKIKTSEMHTVYYEYLEKARRFVEQRGGSAFSEGSQLNAVNRMWKLYGAVPLEAYPGVVSEDGLHDHMRMYREMKAFLDFVEADGLWDEQFVLRSIAAILDRHMGAPPATFKWKGKKYTPTGFVRKVLKIDPDAYVQFMSTMTEPFYSRALFDVPDNWWKDDTYRNVPLETFVELITRSIKGGYSVGIGGDVSEPGKDFRADAAFVPAFDIPPALIDQSAREYRIDNGATGDDHGVHLVGWAEVAGKLWFLIKDSGRSARHGKHDGYYFFREDFVKLKMLTFMVHPDAVKDVLGKFKKPADK